MSDSTENCTRRIGGRVIEVPNVLGQKVSDPPETAIGKKAQ
jgi:hypothetical protein